MATTHADAAPASGTFRELLGPGRFATSFVLAGGVALHATNLFLTTSLLPTAISEIGGERLYAWSSTAFMITSVIASMFVSRLVAGRGPRMAYLIALVPFLAGTVVAALSPTMVVMLVGRGVQGVGGGLLAGLGYAVIQAAYPERLWAKATALVSAMWGFGTLAGPAIGGAFAQFGAWRLAFWLLAVLGVAIALIVPRALPRSAQAEVSEPVPFLSLIVLASAAALISVASVLSDLVWVAVTIAVALVVIAWFIRRERHSAVRVLPASTYSASSPLKWMYLSIGILAIGTVSEAFAPLFGQRLAGLEPLVAGFLGAAVSVGWSVTMLFSSNATRPATLRRMRIAGPAILAAGLIVTGLFQQQDAGPWLVVVWFVALAVAGAGIGIAFPHQLVAVMGSTSDPVEAGKASAGINTVELIGLSFGSALGGLLVNLGAPSMERSAQFLLFGLAVIAVIGVFVARRTDPVR
ncbi:MFS transporter [Kibdelosporangium phytohabitans]|uniref:Multidrug transporter n=1 Tax=Kibdelosporangium phytohabitans TaxID=860235 RepID=A0A0N9HLE4_9PSEU|nr:MFS transporter [Kibdelosporangium phytohabitans]ALG07000.1 multidrug transporter [Kibdelosporangium phytohabitans]MBE1468288.1 MFS family permease [Kibdelosporangium phytohabitans]